MAILREAVGFGTVLPSWSHFALFVGHYMRGDLAQARYHASQLTSEAYSYGHFARALISHREGDDAGAARARAALVALRSAWRDNPRREIGRLITAPAIANRLADDLVAIGDRSGPDSPAD